MCLLPHCQLPTDVIWGCNMPRDTLTERVLFHLPIAALFQHPSVLEPFQVPLVLKEYSGE